MNARTRHAFLIRYGKKKYRLLLRLIYGKYSSEYIGVQIQMSGRSVRRWIQKFEIK